MDRIQEVVENPMGMGRYASFELDEVSYYPSDRVQERIRLAIYAEVLPRVDYSRPLAHTKATGTFTLFIPIEGQPYGILDMRSVEHGKRTDINLSVVSTRALAPNRLHNVSWGNRCSFYGIDEDGSSWSLHCTFSKK